LNFYGQQQRLLVNKCVYVEVTGQHSAEVCGT